MFGVVTIAVEGTTDAAVVKRLLDEAGLSVGSEHGKTGKQTLDRNLGGYNNAAKHSCWLVLRDMDHDAGCAVELAQKLLPGPASHMRLHVVVRALEAWLLADAERIAEHLSVAARYVPPNPESLPNPKRALIDLARRSRAHSAHRDHPDRAS